MLDQVVGGDQDPPALVPEDRVRRAVAGSVEDLELAVAQREELAVGQRAGDVRLAAPCPERRRHLTQRLDDVLRDAVSEHHRCRELVVPGGGGGEILDEAAKRVDRRDLRAGVARDDVDEPEVVHVLVGEDDQLDVVDRIAVLGELMVELVERAPGVRPGVDERQRLVLDQIRVHAADGERRRDPQDVDARLGGAGERLLGRERLGGFHERMTWRSSSVRLSISSFVEPSRLRRRSGSVFDGRTFKCQVS